MGILYYWVQFWCTDLLFCDVMCFFDANSVLND
jgi:hypothetical protein